MAPDSGSGPASPAEAVLGLLGDLDRLAEAVEQDRKRQGAARREAARLEAQLEEARARADRAEKAVELLRRERTRVRKILSRMASGQTAP